MDDFHKALGDINNIRQQVARSTQFRGYGPATLATTSCLAVLAAALQGSLVADPAKHLQGYLALWITTAVVSASLSGWQVYTRSRRLHSGLSDEMIHIAVEQFLPATAAGALITLVIAVYAPVAAWILPGIWQIIFSLGVFASLRFLPKPMVAAAAWYLFTGLFCLSLGDGRTFSPWAMGLPFSVGQILVAAVLFFKSREGNDDE